MKKTFFVIRSGWNSANQSSARTVRNPKNQFESNQYNLVGIVEATNEAQAIKEADCTCYNGQSVFAVTNPRSVKGLTAEIQNSSEISFAGE